MARCDRLDPSISKRSFLSARKREREKGREKRERDGSIQHSTSPSPDSDRHDIQSMLLFGAHRSSWGFSIAACCGVVSCFYDSIFCLVPIFSHQYDTRLLSFPNIKRSPTTRSVGHVDDHQLDKIIDRPLLSSNNPFFPSGIYLIYIVYYGQFFFRCQ